ncbi:glycosyltransferase family 2 protein [Georgenia sp. Marseille-Q6866]
MTVITYKRPESLAAMLDSLHRMQATTPFRVAVVDNDSDGSAEAVVAQHPCEAEYSLETEPGIAAARNRCLDLLEETDDAIAFLDDDEFVSERWLGDLVSVANAYEADLVGGPVMSVVPESAPAWLRSGDFYQRRVRPTGDRSGLPGSGNVLVRRSFLTANADLRFSSTYSFTGGSDTEFFGRLVGERGARLVWSSDAVVSESVQPERLSFRWLLRRYTRGGEVMARVRLQRDSPARLAAEGVLYLAAGLASAPVALLAAPKYRRHSMVLFCRGRGFLRAIRGRYHLEYGRE